MKLRETKLVHHCPNSLHEAIPDPDVGMKLLSAQFEKTMLEALALRGVVVVGDLKRQSLARRQKLESSHVYLNLPTCELGILETSAPSRNPARDMNDRFDPNLLHVSANPGMKDDLSSSVVVTKIDEHNATVISLPHYPAGERNLISLVGKP
jgi:hypothetical protein